MGLGMRVAQSDENFLLAFLAHLYTPQFRAYYGGLLVTDTRGQPKEFRHTEAVKPSKLQITLYGDSLEQSLGSDTLAPALYDALSVKPDLLLIDSGSRRLFSAFAHQHQPSGLLVVLDDPDKAFAESLDADGALLEAKQYALKEDRQHHIYGYLAESSGNPAATRALQLAQFRMNLISPFDRIRNVLTEIAAAENEGRRT